MQITITAKIKIKPTEDQVSQLNETMIAYRQGCNFVSRIVFESVDLKQASLHKVTYGALRTQYGLRSQMAQSVMKTVIARYKTNKSNGYEWSLVTFKRLEYDLVWNRDYSLSKEVFSLNTVEGRIKVPYESKGMEQYFESEWSFGTAKLVNKYGKWFLHIPMTKEVEDVLDYNINNVVGVDLGINFVATTYDSQDSTLFFNGRPIKHKRSKYKFLRKQLQQLGTASSRRKLKRIGQRESRWMTDVNHQISKALVDHYGSNTMFVIEDLSGVRNATEMVRVKDRYVTVSWSFFEFRQMLVYKAVMSGSKVLTVDPRYTSQTCPKCGHTEKANRDKTKHVFCCKNCCYTSNDDRVGAMNLHRKGIEYIAEVTA